MNISVVIPVYKNKEDFLKNLRTNAKYLKSCEIIIVNDDPQDFELKIAVKKICPTCLYIKNDRNMGFGLSVNRAITLAKHNYIMLLNSDVILSDTSYILAKNKLEKSKRLFAVGFAQVEKNGSIVGANTGKFTEGLFVHSGKICTKECATLWPEGGSCLLKKDIFTILGGYDRMYSPFYWEDVDLGYRAWKNNYTILFMPSILVKHHHETTIRRYFPDWYIRFVAQRNQLLFVWKNMGTRFTVQHLLLLPLYAIRALFHNVLFFVSLIAALGKLPHLLSFRSKKRDYITDDIITQLVQ
ncbi:MAG: glycosyltransferase [Candidatus Roizmanbacteria bacterium]|nr:glycosyltransferase [Candidatus Roizmanbacteria bacterium]